jgi:5-oxoprolinase (ATP-hydrolysing) subunit A
MAPVIDLNADLGEEAGHDLELLEIVTSANVACGAHAGGPGIAEQTVRAAAARGVVVGAHPGHADRDHFGRRAIPIKPRALEALLEDQLAVIEAAGGARYLKLHGALYHQAAESPELAAATVRVARRAGIAILGPPGSELLDQAARADLEAIAEGFIDRGYRLARGRPELVPRGEPRALLSGEQAIDQAVRLATAGTVLGPGGERVALPARSLCVHGDSPGAVELAVAVRTALEQAGVQLRPFAG